MSVTARRTGMTPRKALQIVISIKSYESPFLILPSANPKLLKSFNSVPWNSWSIIITHHCVLNLISKGFFSSLQELKWTWRPLEDSVLLQPPAVVLLSLDHWPWVWQYGVGRYFCCLSVPLLGRFPFWLREKSFLWISTHQCTNLPLSYSHLSLSGNSSLFLEDFHSWLTATVF